MADITVFLTTTGANTWTVPSDWSNVNTIRCIAGGSAGCTLNTSCGCSPQGVGGSYAGTTNLVLTPNGSASYNVSSASTGDTWISNTGVAPTSSSEGALAKRAQASTTNCIGSTTFAGGNVGTSTGLGCGGAGGGAGPGGRGGNGGNGAGGKTLVRGGGGGGAGTTNQGGDGSGGTAGTGGATGGGNGGAGGSGGGSGANGSAGTSFTATVGGATAGGGGGAGAGQGSGQTGGNGGLYGGGGGSCTFNPSCGVGAGTQGVIIITYTAASGVKRNYVWEF